MSILESRYDGWLNKYFMPITGRLTVVELGCGRGDDTSFLVETGHRIVACDISDAALAVVEQKYEDAETLRFDMLDDFPINTDFADIVIASLCLHFFDDRGTSKILSEIRRILKPEGMLLCRLNSERDRLKNRPGEVFLGDGMYMTDEGIKRFYDEVLIKTVFSGWRIMFMEEKTAEKFSKTKSLWELALLPRLSG